jgi:hypothetical protein
MTANPNLALQTEALFDEMAEIGELTLERASIRLRAMIDNLDRTILAGVCDPSVELLSIAAIALRARGVLLTARPLAPRPPAAKMLPIGRSGR